jgi:hypothetical protein
MIIYNSTRFKRTPVCILDVTTNSVYPADLKSLLHLGAKSLKIFTEDFKDTLCAQKPCIEVFGLPSISALFQHKLQVFHMSNESEKLES